MSLDAFLRDLAARGVALSAEGGSLTLRAPRGALTEADRERLLAEKPAILARLAAPRGAAPDDGSPFPLTEIQEAYLVGRAAEMELGRVACHAYREFEGPPLDLDRLEAAWDALVARHDMLRAVFEDGRQRILPTVPRFRIPLEDLRDVPDLDAALAARRAERSHRVHDPASWPLFAIHAMLLPGGRMRLAVGIDLLLADAAALVTIFREWGALYAAPNAALPPLPGRFRDHIAALPSPRAPDRAYWEARLDELPAGPDLPRLPLDGPPRFARRSFALAAPRWAALKRAAAAEGITPTALVAAAFADVLAAFSRRARFCLTLTQFAAPPEQHGVVGDYTTTLLLECDSRPATFRDRARALQRRLLQDLEHGAMSGIAVLRELRRRRPDAGPVPVVFTSTLGAERAPAEALAWLGATVFAVTQTPQVLLDHHVHEAADGSLSIGWDLVEAAFPPGVVDAMASAYAGLLEALAAEQAGWDRPVTACRPAQPRAALLPAAAPEMLHAAIERAARAVPDRPAVIAPDLTLDHATLDRAASHLAATVAARLQGDPRDRLVAIGLPKGWRQVVAVLAALKAGAAYLPVDPALPAERRALLIAEGEALPLEDAAEVDAALAAARAGVPVPALPAVADPARLAYVIYTSGSTGRPKGVMIEHGAAVATVAEINRRWSLAPADRVLGLSALGFDLSVWDVFGVLGAGGALVLPEPERLRDPAHWADLLRAHRVTCWNSVPALMAMLAEHGLPQDHALRLVMLSGDWVPPPLVRRLRAAAPDAHLVALGGATEAAIWSNAHESGAALDPDWPSIPYGLPLAGQMLRVVNERGEECPDWVIGEIRISGAGLARGYWKDPARTAERFVRNELTGERQYRTGDLGRFRPHRDGGPTPIEFLGREDFQVKIQGHRIELGEIEATLDTHPEVARAVVTVQDTPAGRALHGFVLPRPEAWVKAALVLERRALRRLPDAARIPLPGRPEPDAYAARRSVRRFAPAPVPRDALEALLRVGRGAALVLAQRVDGAAPAALRWNGAALDACGPLPAVEVPDPATARIAAGAGALILFEAGAGRGPALRQAGAAAQRMAEAAASLGLGLCAVGVMRADGCPALHALAVGVPASEVSGVDLAGALREHCAALLPPWMVPRRIHLVEALPLSSNGKVDRAALRPPEDAASGEAATGALARQVAALVADAVGQAVDPRQNLFDAGATSLHMVRLQRLLAERMGSQLGVVDLFRLPTIAAIAAALAGEGAAHSVAAGQDRAARRRMARQGRA